MHGGGRRVSVNGLSMAWGLGAYLVTPLIGGAHYKQAGVGAGQVHGAGPVVALAACMSTVSKSLTSFTNIFAVVKRRILFYGSKKYYL